MPLYDYRCIECGREVEVMHGIHDSGPATCETCGGTMRKALSPPAIHFKGSGWAKKDAAAATAKKTKPKADSKSEAAKPSDDAKPTSGDTGTTQTAPSPKGESQSKAPSSAGSKTE